MVMVSVVVPTYNRNELLENRCLPSILRQTYRDLEVHVVSDGMVGDQLFELGNVVARAQAKAPDIRFYHWNIPHQVYPEDIGQKWCVLGLNALNHGLDHAQGEWVGVLADDDEWEPHHVEVLLREAKLSGVDFVYGMSAYHWPDGHPQTAGSWPPGMGAFCDGAYLYRNHMGYRYDPECISRGLPEDGDLWIRMVNNGVRFKFIAKIVHHYWVNPR